MQIDGSDNEFAKAEYDNLIERLEANRIDPIAAGHNYNQSDITRKLKTLK